MSNFVYGKFKEALFNGQINILSNNYRIVLLNKSSYTPNQNTHEFLSDIPSSAIKAVSSNISNITNTLGTIDANDISFSSYSGQYFDAIVMYQVGASDASSRLIFFIDTSSGLPFNGSNSSLPVTIIWNNEISKILSL